MIATEALPAVSPEVLAFATEQGVTGSLPAMLEMTRRIFPTLPLAVLVEDDPEIANDRHIVFEVDISGQTVAQINPGRMQWCDEIFQHCPATHAWVFRLGTR